MILSIFLIIRATILDTHGRCVINKWRHFTLLMNMNMPFIFRDLIHPFLVDELIGLLIYSRIDKDVIQTVDGDRT